MLIWPHALWNTHACIISSASLIPVCGECDVVTAVKCSGTFHCLPELTLHLPPRCVTVLSPVSLHQTNKGSAVTPQLSFSFVLWLNSCPCVASHVWFLLQVTLLLAGSSLLSPVTLAFVMERVCAGDGFTFFFILVVSLFTLHWVPSPSLLFELSLKPGCGQSLCFGDY